MSAKPTYEQLEQRVCELEKKIGECKQAEKVLLESEQTYKNVVENVSVGILVTQDLRLVFANKAISEYLGYTPDELINSPNPFDFIHPEDREMVFENHLKRLNGEEVPPTYPFRVVTKEGDTIWVESTGIRINWRGKPAITNFFTEITERIQAEEKLKEAKDYLENVFENSADTIGIVDSRGYFVKWNKMAAKMYGYDFEALKGKSYYDLYADKDELEKMLTQLRREGFIKEYEINMKKKDGSVFLCNLSISILRDVNNNNIGSVCVARDLSEIKKAQQELKDSEERLRQLSEATIEGVIIIENGKIITSNQVFAKMFGYTFEEVVGKEAIGFVAPQDRNFVINQTLAGYEEPYEFTGIKKDGTMFPAEACGKAVQYQGRTVRQTAVRDLSERKKAEEERVQHEKLQGVLEIAGAVCHEMNQPLMAISGYAELILMDMLESDPFREKLIKIKNQINRLGSITQKLMSITKYETKEYLDSKIIDIDKSGP